MKTMPTAMVGQPTTSRLPAHVELGVSDPWLGRAARLAVLDDTLPLRRFGAYCQKFRGVRNIEAFVFVVAWEGS
jgi:hypothetical protein